MKDQIRSFSSSPFPVRNPPAAVTGTLTPTGSRSWKSPFATSPVSGKHRTRPRRRCRSPPPPKSDPFRPLAIHNRHDAATVPKATKAPSSWQFPAATACPAPDFWQSPAAVPDIPSHALPTPNAAPLPPKSPLGPTAWTPRSFSLSSPFFRRASLICRACPGRAADRPKPETTPAPTSPKPPAPLEPRFLFLSRFLPFQS